MKKNKNIVTLIIFLSVTIIVCVYALKWHSVYKEEGNNRAIITNYTQEIKRSELNNYIIENPYAVVYFGKTNDANCRKFEKKLQEFIIEKELRENIVYLNVDDIEMENFETMFDSLYNNEVLRQQNKYLNKVPAVAVYDHTKLVDFISDENLSVQIVKELLKKYNVGENK